MAELSGWAIAAIVSSVVSAGAATYNAAQSSHAAKQQKKMAEDTQKASILEQQQQGKEALAERKELINQQRENLVQGYRTSTRGETPKPSSNLIGKLGDDTLG